MSEFERECLREELLDHLLRLRKTISAIPGRLSEDAGDELFAEVCAVCFDRFEQYAPWTDGRVMQIAWNRWHAHLRKVYRRPSHSALRDAEGVVTERSPEEYLSYRERCARLRGVHRRLRKSALIPKEYRRVLWKRFVQNKSIREIAADLGCRLETVRTWYKRARTELRRDPVLRQLAGS